MLHNLKTIPKIFWVLVFITLVNIVQFPTIEGANQTAYKALFAYENSDVTAIGSKRSVTVRSHWLSSLTLGEVAPSSNVYLPNDFKLEEQRLISWLYSFGKISSLKSTSVSSQEILDNINPEKHIVASGENMLDEKPYFAIAMKNSGTELIVRDIPGLLTVADLPVSQGTSFVLLKWKGPQESLHPKRQKNIPPYYHLFVDVELLPKGLKTRIAG